MPTYVNNSTSTIIYNNTRWSAGEVKAVQFTVPGAYANLVKTSDDPSIVIFVVSTYGSLNDNELRTINLPPQPKEDVMYAVSVACPGSGYLEVGFNDMNNRVMVSSGWGIKGNYPSYILSKLILLGHGDVLDDDTVTQAEYNIFVEQYKILPNLVY